MLRAMPIQIARECQRGLKTVSVTMTWMLSSSIFQSPDISPQNTCKATIVAQIAVDAAQNVYSSRTCSNANLIKWGSTPRARRCPRRWITRPPFSKAVQNRSPILGLTDRTVLRICFRIGEALNAAAVALRENVDAIIEFYARVVSSSREASGGYKQYF